jgi:hypothetical protein
MAIPATDAVQAISFLRHLFKPYQDGFIEIRPLSKHNPVHANRTTYRIPECLKGESGQALSQHIISLAMRGYDVYVGVCPRAAPEGPGRKLGKESIEYVGALWLDLDSKVPGSSQALLDTCDIVVSTGNGWHGYKVAPTPMRVSSPKERTAVEAKVRSFANSLLPGTDNVANVDRILRVPGTINWKDPDNPKAVQLLKGGGMKPTYKESLVVAEFGDARLDALLASAKAGELGHASPMIHHASGRYTGCLDTFFLELEQACIKSKADARWTFLLAIVRADLPEIMRHYFG